MFCRNDDEDDSGDDVADDTVVVAVPVPTIRPVTDDVTPMTPGVKADMS